MSLFSASDVASFRVNRLDLVQRQYFPKAKFTDEFLLQEIQAAEQEVSMLLKILFEPTAIFGRPPTDAEIAALGCKPYIEEPGYDYDPDFFASERWGYIVTRARPIISVTSVDLAYPAPTNQVYRIPDDWLRLDKKYGHIRMVPASSTFVAPLGAFLMQALSAGSTIPSMIQVQYEAGLQDAKKKYPALIDVILKRAVQKIMIGAFLPGSESISADGLSQSASVKLEDYETQFQIALYGPKGANGGLFTFFNGLQMSVLGVTA